MRSVIIAVALATAVPAIAQEPLNAAQADAFVQDAERQLEASYDYGQRAGWVNWTYMTEDTSWIAARASADASRLASRLAASAARFDRVAGLSGDAARKIYLIKQATVLPPPARAGAAEELGALSASLQAIYATARGTHGGVSLPGDELDGLIGTVRDPMALAEIWQARQDGVRGMREDYARMVSLANEGARELGYADTGALWRSGYDMPPEEFEALADRLWLEVKPFYEQLHCYARDRLSAKYGPDVQPASGPIRADLLGTMWGHKWQSIYDIVAPPGGGDKGYDLTGLLVAGRYDAKAMVRSGERFFTSIGFDKLPSSFWERSMFVRPQDRDVVCHASAWTLGQDMRIKMCIRPTADDFSTIHHELGHLMYERSFAAQPFLYRTGPNDAFQEAVADFVHLSLTPDYLVGAGILPVEQKPGPDAEIGVLLSLALTKVAAQPFGLLVDKWRWGVFSGKITPENYNKSWHDLRLRYQGVVPPVERSEADFDPGTLFHVPAGISYIRYFLARFLQFQFHEAACREIGWKGPLHRCSVYGSKAAGDRMRAMLTMGASRPWLDALEAFTGNREISAGAMLRYFRPLEDWLRKQNAGRQCGW